MERYSSETEHSIEPDGLAFPSKGTRERLKESEQDHKARLNRIAASVRSILLELGEDPDRDGLLKTPMRYANALMTFTRGYETNVEEVLNKAIFEEDHDEMVIIRNIPISSMCEHHMVPFHGRISIGYLPTNQVVGLSKLVRLSEMFARRLQVQERLTRQIASALMEVLNARGVGVVIEATHMCMVMRGVEKTGCDTVTSCMLGEFRANSKTREEFLTLINKK